MSELLKITNVTKKYHHFKALNNVSMTLASGKIIGLLGPNGSGKTTLIKIINGLLKDYEGEVLVDGKNVGIDSRKIDDSIVSSILFNFRNIFDFMCFGTVVARFY